jgi:chitinase
MSYSTYITSWDKNPYDQVQDMLNNNVIKSNTRIILAFASFNFSSTTYIPGLNNLSIDDLIKLTNLVHSNNSKISLSIGGATYPFYNSDLYSKPGDLANNINIMLNKCNFDGVDFDIEDSSSNVPSNFASNTASLINTLRSLNSNLNITLTTPAQAWGATNYQQSLLNMTIGNINAWQPMEYDLWIDSTLDYYSQIEFDIDYYINNWSVNSNKIILGLMPGKNDMMQDLTLVDALNLTTFAKNNELQGVMTWDANIDSKGVDGNAPYAYSLGIESILNNNNKYSRSKNNNKNNNILPKYICYC